jgi:5'-3' exonuclease
MDMLQSINKIIMDFHPTKLIIAMDAGNYWRKEYYPEYKANRKIIRNASIIDFDKFFEVVNLFTESLKKLLPNICFLNVPTCEADDIIAILTKKYINDEVICISTDRDMYQLLKYPNYKQWDSIKKQYIECLDPETYLLTKIMSGDIGDNIPNVKKGVGKVRINKILNENLEGWLNEDINHRNNFERNFRLISFEAIPTEIETNIIDTYKNYQYKNFVSYNLFNFLIDQQIGNLSCYIDKYSNSFNSIKI